MIRRVGFLLIRKGHGTPLPIPPVETKEIVQDQPKETGANKGNVTEHIQDTWKNADKEMLARNAQTAAAVASAAGITMPSWAHGALNQLSGQQAKEQEAAKMREQERQQMEQQRKKEFDRDGQRERDRQEREERERSREQKRENSSSGLVNNQAFLMFIIVLLLVIVIILLSDDDKKQKTNRK